MQLLRCKVDFEGVQLLRDDQPYASVKNASGRHDKALNDWDPDEDVPEGIKEPQTASKSLIKLFFAVPCPLFYGTWQQGMAHF